MEEVVGWVMLLVEVILLLLLVVSSGTLYNGLISRSFEWDMLLGSGAQSSTLRVVKAGTSKWCGWSSSCGSSYGVGGVFGMDMSSSRKLDPNWAPPLKQKLSNWRYVPQAQHKHNIRLRNAKLAPKLCLRVCHF